MPNAVLVLILVAIALLALIDMGLGQVLPDNIDQQGTSARIGLREFVTRPLPIFLFGVNAAKDDRAPGASRKPPGHLWDMRPWRTLGGQFTEPAAGCLAEAGRKRETACGLPQVAWNRLGAAAG